MSYSLHLQATSICDSAGSGTFRCTTGSDRDGVLSPHLCCARILYKEQCCSMKKPTESQLNDLRVHRNFFFAYFGPSYARKLEFQFGFPRDAIRRALTGTRRIEPV